MDNTTNTPNQDDLNQIIKEVPVSDTPVSDANVEAEQKYKQILDEYAKQLEETAQTTVVNNPSPVPETIPVIPPSPVPETIVKSNTEALAPLENKPEEFQPIAPETQLPPSLPPVENIQNTPEPTKGNSGFNIFKYLFYLSTIILIVISALLIKDYLKLQQLKKNPVKSPTPTIIPTTAPVTSDGSSCTVNDKQYVVGESFEAEDGCNTCECQQTDNGPQMICTLIDCSAQTTK